MKYTLIVTILFALLTRAYSEPLPRLFHGQTYKSLPKQVHLLGQQLEKNISFSSEFNQIKKLVIISKPLVSNGTFIFFRNKGIAWDTHKPIKSKVIITQQEIVQRQPDRKDFVISRSSDPTLKQLTNIFMNLLTGNFDMLESNFTIYFQPAKPNWLLGLTPKDKNLKQIIKAILITANNYIQKVTIYEQGGDLTNIKFDQPKPSTQETVLSEYFQ